MTVPGHAEGLDFWHGPVGSNGTVASTKRPFTSQHMDFPYCAVRRRMRICLKFIEVSKTCRCIRWWSSLFKPKNPQHILLVALFAASPYETQPPPWFITLPIGLHANPERLHSVKSTSRSLLLPCSTPCTASDPNPKTDQKLMGYRQPYRHPVTWTISNW